MTTRRQQPSSFLFGIIIIMYDSYYTLYVISHKSELRNRIFSILNHI